MRKKEVAATWALSANQLDQAIARLNSADDGLMMPVLRAVRDHRFGFLIVPQNAGRFWPPKARTARPVVAFLCDDDPDEPMGPATAFHTRSLARLLKECGAAIVVACQARREFSEAAVAYAVEHDRSVVIVQCFPETQDAWLDTVKRHGITAILAGVVRGREPAAKPDYELGELPDLPQPTVQ